MKKRRAVLLSCVFVLSCMLLSGSVMHENSKDGSKITEAYDYPVKPGTKEWLALPSVIERREACEIPQDILERMTTSALVESVLTYPFFVDALGAFESFEEGLNWVSTYFSGIDELLSRADAGECLCDYLVQKKERYEELSAIDLSEKTPEQVREFCEYKGAENLLQYIETQTFSDDLTWK